MLNINFVENINFNKNGMELKIENFTEGFRKRQTLCFSSYKNRKLVGARERKKLGFFVPFILSKGNVFDIVFNLSV